MTGALLVASGLKASDDLGHAAPAAPKATAGHGDSHGASTGGSHAPAAAHAVPKPETPEQVIQLLKAGNSRYRKGQIQNQRQDASRTAAALKNPKPYAAVISCSDNWVPPEVAFDEGLGDLFVIKTPGHTVDDKTIGSLQYAVETLGVKAIVVMGHTNCNAVRSSVGTVLANAPADALSGAIKPAVLKAKTDRGNLYKNSILRNIEYTTEALFSAKPKLGAWAEDGRVTIVGALHDLESGRVRFLGDDEEPSGCDGCPSCSRSAHAAGQDSHGDSHGGHAAPAKPVVRAVRAPARRLPLRSAHAAPAAARAPTPPRPPAAAHPPAKEEHPPAKAEHKAEAKAEPKKDDNKKDEHKKEEKKGGH